MYNRGPPPRTPPHPPRVFHVSATRSRGERRTRSRRRIPLSAPHSALGAALARRCRASDKARCASFALPPLDTSVNAATRSVSVPPTRCLTTSCPRRAPETLIIGGAGASQCHRCVLARRDVLRHLLTSQYASATRTARSTARDEPIPDLFSGTAPMHTHRLCLDAPLIGLAGKYASHLQAHTYL